MKNKAWFKYVLWAAGGLAVCAGIVLGIYFSWEKEPEIPPAPVQTVEPTARIQQAESTETAFENVRHDGIYTLLLVGNDDGNGNTDTIILSRFDTARNTVDIVSIPRDTIVNLDWRVRKLNAVYWSAVNDGQVGIEALSEQIKRLTGFKPDCYAVVDMDVVEQAVDLVGGIWFDVPWDMDYEDPSQQLSIHVEKGYQKLDGEQAMGVIRFRDTYSDGDLGRIQVQQQFLKAAAEQVLTAGNIPNIQKLAKLLEEGTDTNLSAANVAWFIRQFMQCEAEDINFMTAPNVPEMVAGLSYTFLELEPWLELVNSSLNPYKSPVTEANVDLVYLSAGEVKCTRELQGEWYYRVYTENSGLVPAIGGGRYK